MICLQFIYIYIYIYIYIHTHTFGIKNFLQIFFKVSLPAISKICCNFETFHKLRMKVCIKPLLTYIWVLESVIFIFENLIVNFSCIFQPSNSILSYEIEELFKFYFVRKLEENILRCYTRILS